MRKGYVLLFTGDGKGKTTSALGIAFRAAGWGMKTYIAQFMKGCETGELKAAERFRDLIKIELFGSKRLVSPQRLVEEDKKLAQNGLLRAREAMFSGHYDIVILDEKILQEKPPAVAFSVPLTYPSLAMQKGGGTFGGIPLDGYKNPRIIIYASKDNELTIYEYDLTLPPTDAYSDKFDIKKGKNIIELQSFSGIVSFRLKEEDFRGRVRIELK